MASDPHPAAECAGYQTALEVLGHPWTGLILTQLQNGPVRYSELTERVPGIGDKTLSARLKDLEARGLVARQVHPGPPVRVEYALTPVGKGFQRVGEAVAGWGKELLAAERRSKKAR